jgi:O-antigen ligase
LESEKENLLNVKNVFVLFIASAILLPYVPIAGPLSTDDVMPLLAVILALSVIPFSRHSGRKLLDSAALVLVLFALCALLSSAVNSDSLVEFIKMSGKSTGRLIFYFVFIMSVRVLITNATDASKALYIFAALATVEALFCIWAYKNQYQGPYGIGIADVPNWSVLRGHVRVHGTFSGALSVHEKSQVSANFLASYLILTVPVTFGLALVAKGLKLKLLMGGAAGLQLLTLYLTYTRASIVALGVGILGMGWLLKKRAWAIAVVVLVAVVSLSIPSMRAKFLKEGHNRYSLWSASINTFVASPTAGIGDGNYMESLSQNHHLHDTDYGVANATAHNSLLMSAANYGFMGITLHALLYLALICVTLVSVRRARGRNRILAAAIAGAILSYLLQDQFNNLHYIPKVSTQMWFLFALLPALAIPKEPTP